MWCKTFLLSGYKWSDYEGISFLDDPNSFNLVTNVTIIFTKNPQTAVISIWGIERKCRASLCRGSRLWRYGGRTSTLEEGKYKGKSTGHPFLALKGGTISVRTGAFPLYVQSLQKSPTENFFYARTKFSPLLLDISVA